MEFVDQRPWEAIRKDFPILNQTVNGHPLIYFDNAATSQKPRAVIDTLSHFYERDNSNVHRGLHELSNRATAAYEESREAAGRLPWRGGGDDHLHARHDRKHQPRRSARGEKPTWAKAISSFSPRWSITAISCRGSSSPAARGQRCGSFPSLPTACSTWTTLDELLDGPVKIFSFTHISNTLGTINPAADLCARARRAGVTTLVDAAQSAGHRPLDVREMGCDFLALSGHKMCGPTGAGVLYGRKEILEAMEPFHGGGEMIVSVAFTESEFKPPPHRFEAGTPAIAQAIGLGASAGYLDKIGRQRIFDHDQALALQASALIEEIPGVRIFGPREARAGLVSFVHGSRSRARCGQHGGPIRTGIARRPSLHPAASAKTRRAGDGPGQFLFLQHRGGGHSHGRDPPQNSCLLRMNVEELYQEVILDHSKRPRNFGPLPDATATVKGDNPSCGDEVELAVKLTPADH